MSDDTGRKVRVDGRWKGGVAYSLAIQQFKLLFRRYGPRRAMELAEEAITWPDNRRPEPQHYQQWCVEDDTEQTQIPPEVETAFYRRLDNMMKAHAEAAFIANAKTSIYLNELIRQGKFSPQQASQLMHANNALGWIYKNVFEPKTKETVRQTLVLGFTEPPKPKKLAGATKVIDVTPSRIEVGS